MPAMNNTIEQSLMKLVDVLRVAIESGLENIPVAAEFLLKELVAYYTMMSVGFALFAVVWGILLAVSVKLSIKSPFCFHE